MIQPPTRVPNPGPKTLHPTNPPTHPTHQPTHPPTPRNKQVEPLIEAHGEALFRLVHTAPFTVALQALLLLFQLLSGRNAVSDRFYRALYTALLLDGVRAGSKAPQFLALLFKAMKADPSAKRCAAFAKRLLQVAADAPPSWAAGALLLLSEVLRAQPALWSGVQQAEEGADDEERFVDVELDSEDERAAGDADGKRERERQRAAKAEAKAAASGGEVVPAWPREGGYDMRKRCGFGGWGRGGVFLSLLSDG